VLATGETADGIDCAHMPSVGRMSAEIESDDKLERVTNVVSVPNKYKRQ